MGVWRWPWEALDEVRGFTSLGHMIWAYAYLRMLYHKAPADRSQVTGVSWDGNVEFFNESLGIWEAHKKQPTNRLSWCSPGVAERPPTAIQKHVQITLW